MSGTVQYFGDFLEASLDTSEFMIVNFSSETLNLDDLWESSALSARFLSSVWGRFIPASDRDHHQRRRVIEDSVRFISAELLGNAVKFGRGQAFHIRINLHMEHNELRIYVTNAIEASQVEPLLSHIRRLLRGDLGEMYVTQMEENARSSGELSHMGFLTILLDHDALLGWKLELSDEGGKVTTLARLPVVRDLDRKAV